MEMIPLKEAMAIVGHLLPNQSNTELSRYNVRIEYRPYVKKKQGTKYHAIYNKRDIIRLKEYLTQKKRQQPA